MVPFIMTLAGSGEVEAVLAEPGNQPRASIGGAPLDDETLGAAETLRDIVRGVAAPSDDPDADPDAKYITTDCQFICNRLQAGRRT